MSDHGSAQHRTLTAVLADIARTGRPEITRPEEVATAFGDPDGLLRLAQHRWYAAVYAHLDALLEDPPPDLPAAVGGLWRSLAARHAPVRALLDAHAHHPTLRAADRHHRRVLLETVGVDVAALPPAPPSRTGARCPRTLVGAWLGRHRTHQAA